MAQYTNMLVNVHYTTQFSLNQPLGIQFLIRECLVLKISMKYKLCIRNGHQGAGTQCQKALSGKVAQENIHNEAHTTEANKFICPMSPSPCYGPGPTGQRFRHGSGRRKRFRHQKETYHMNPGNTYLYSLQTKGIINVYLQFPYVQVDNLHRI